MKRDNTKYTNVICGDIYNHYGLFSWRECFFCNKEFRREGGYRFQMQVDRPWVYSCSSCSGSKEEVNENVDKFLKRRPKAPPRPNNLTLEQAFEIMLEKYKDALDELSKK